MTKMGNLIDLPFHWLCQAHGLHLAVTDLLYTKKKKSDELEDIFSQSTLDDQVI
jgi:hypothetical protein